MPPTKKTQWTSPPPPPKVASFPQGPKVSTFFKPPSPTFENSAYGPDSFFEGLKNPPPPKPPLLEVVFFEGSTPPLQAQFRGRFHSPFFRPTKHEYAWEGAGNCHVSTDAEPGSPFEIFRVTIKVSKFMGALKPRPL